MSAPDSAAAPAKSDRAANTSLDRMQQPVRRATILAYLGTFVGAFVLANLVLRFGIEGMLLKHSLGQADAAPGHLRNADAKTAHYLAHTGEYNLLFLGDSRTLCGIDPEVIDAELGTHSVNLAHWAHWIDTQYPNYARLAPHIPKETRVVWSVGHLVFQPIHPTTNLSYPIGLTDVPQYLKWGYPLSRIAQNVATSIPGLDVYARREQFRIGVDGRVNALLFAAKSRINNPILRNTDAFTALQLQLANDTTVARVDAIVDTDEITSAAIWTKAGHYSRVEFDHGFFRQKQRDNELAYGHEIASAEFDAYAPLWNTFVGMLDLFQKSHVHLIVNEIHEAPYKYKIPKNERIYREFMAKVQREVEAHGFQYTRADFDQFHDEDYFDFDHFNSVGAERYSHMLAKLLGPNLAP